MLRLSLDPRSHLVGLLPELLQSACKIVIATANNAQTTLASLLPRLTDKRLFVFGAGRYNSKGVSCFFTTSWCVPCLKYSHTWYKSGILADHALGHDTLRTMCECIRLGKPVCIVCLFVCLSLFIVVSQTGEFAFFDTCNRL